MFVSFFPRPKLFFSSALLWTILAVLGWYEGGAKLGGMVGFPSAAPDAAPSLARASSGLRRSYGSISISQWWRWRFTLFGLASPASMAALVDPWFGSHPVYDLFQCSGQRRDQCLVWPILRHGAEGVEYAGCCIRC